MIVRRALLDANVLFPQMLRDVLLSLAYNGVFAARWTDEIHDEWTRNLQRQRPDLTPTQLGRTRDLMNLQIDESLVEGYEPLIETLQLPDADDRHVLAAAIHAGAPQIVTWNLKDFPTSVLQIHGIEAVSPDAFLAELWEVSSPLIVRALKEQRRRLKNPRQTPAQFLEMLQRQRLTRFVALLRPLESQI